MKRLNLFLFFFLCPLMAFGQLKVDVNGNIFIGSSSSRFLGSNDPMTPFVFKVNGVLAGKTGHLGGTNISFGYGALSNNSSGGPNTAFGYEALYNNTTGNYNTAVGNYVLRLNNTGNYNTAIGNNALYSNTTGKYNTANGYDALRSNNAGNFNTANGYYALRSNTGEGNTANGYNALSSNTTGNYNTAVGNSTLSNNSGSYNTAVGYYASGSNANNLSNTTAIGYHASNSASNQVRLGNSSVTSIGGYAGWSNISDGRAKKNIRAEVPGLAFINLLQPVTYNLDLDALDEIQKSDDPEINRFTDSLRLARSPEEKEILAKAKANKEKQVYSGFIAQDVEKAAQSVGYDFSGVDAPENEKSAYGLRYAEFVVPLVKAVQELSEKNEAKDAAIVSLQAQINELTAKLDKLINAQISAKAVVTDEIESAKNFSFSLFPNPTNGFVTVDYTLYAGAQICIELYNMYGQRVKLIVPQQIQKAGIYSVQISVDGLTNGAYIVKVTSGNQIESKQLVVTN